MATKLRRGAATLWCCCVAGAWCLRAGAQQTTAPQGTSAATPAAPAIPVPPSTTPNSATPGQGDAVVIRVESNAVLVPVVVRDVRGRAVGNLQKEDFEVFDQGKQQVISGFTIEKRAVREVEAAVAAATPSDSHGVFPGVVPAPESPAVPGPKRFVVFLFDDLHLSVADMAQVQVAATRMLEGALGGADMADVVSFTGTNSGMTRDRAKLQEAIGQLRVHQLFREVGRQCPNMDYYLADLIINKHESMATQAAIQDTISCANLKPQEANIAERMVQVAAAKALSIGDQDVRVALGFVKELVHRMATLPGERMVIFVSPGFLATSAEALSFKSQIMDVAAQSKVTVSALDARGLYTTNLDASEHGDTTKFGMMTGQAQLRHSESETINEDVMAELADGTGGTFFHNSNDLEGGFKRLTEAPEYQYVLEFSPQNVKANGSYHGLKVKVRGSGLKLQARRGYYAPNAERGKK